MFRDRLCKNFGNIFKGPAILKNSFKARLAEERE
jgi:hypothetical protein